MSSNDKDWIWKTILALALVGIMFGVGSKNSPVSFDKLVSGGKQLIHEWKKPEKQR